MQKKIIKNWGARSRDRDRGINRVRDGDRGVDRVRDRDRGVNRVRNLDRVRGGGEHVTLFEKHSLPIEKKVEKSPS